MPFHKGQRIYATFIKGLGTTHLLLYSVGCYVDGHEVFHKQVRQTHKKNGIHELLTKRRLLSLIQS